MKKVPNRKRDPEMLDEYDFSQGVRGKYARRYAEGTNVVVLAPDVATVFPDSESVNEALRALVTADERVTGVKFTKDTLSVALRDGRTITVPLAWYPRLLNASAAERKNWRVAGGGFGIHWPDIDEDLSTEGLLRGAPAPRPRQVDPTENNRRGRAKR